MKRGRPVELRILPRSFFQERKEGMRGANTGRNVRHLLICGKFHPLVGILNQMITKLFSISVAGIYFDFY